MSTQTFANPDGSKAIFIVPDPTVELQDPIVTATGNVVTVAAQPPVVTIGTPSYEWTPAPPVPTVAKPVRTPVGGTPRGKSDKAGITTMDGAYGGPADVSRLFFQGSLQLPAVPDERSLIGSFTSTAGITVTMASAYTWIALDHEINRKSIPTWQTDMATMAKAGIDNLCVIFTAGGFAKADKGAALAKYLLPGITHIGVDFDGISFPDHYHDYSAELANVIAFCKLHSLTWGVPEFGANRATNDLDGSARAAWLVHWVKAFRDAGAEYVCLWEQDSQAGSTFTTPVEIATVRTMFALAS